MATLLAQEEVYNALSREGDTFGKKAAPQHRSGFSSWMQTLSSKSEENEIEQHVRSRMLNKQGGYGREIFKQVPSAYDSELPALATQAAHEATERAYHKLRAKLVQAGEWNKGYLPSGHDLLHNPLDFDGKFVNDKQKLG
eukprot:765047-Hanusia_phi.AAC.6